MATIIPAAMLILYQAFLLFWKFKGKAAYKYYVLCAKFVFKKNDLTNWAKRH